MIGDSVQAVAGDRAQVIEMGPSVDPHLYKPTRNDMLALSKADLVVGTGLYLEGRLVDAFKSLPKKGVPVLLVGEQIAADQLIDPNDGSGHLDPHIWLDVALWSQTYPAIAEALAKIDPAGADEYRARAKARQAELAQWHDWAKAQIATIPAGKRVLVTAHDAFQYFSRAYGIEVLGVQGISTESEAGLADINRLVDVLVSRQVLAIFVESSVADKNIRALIEGAKARAKKLLSVVNSFLMPWVKAPTPVPT